MSSESACKLSLVSQFDDLCRYDEVLRNGCETEFIHFVQNHSKLLEDMKKASAELEELKEKNYILEMEKEAYENEIKKMKSEVATEYAKRRKAESEICILEKKLSSIFSILDKEINVDPKTKARMDLVLGDLNCIPEQPISKSGALGDSIGSLLSLSDCDETYNQPILSTSLVDKQFSEVDTPHFFNTTFNPQCATGKNPDFVKIDTVPEVEKCLAVYSSSELNSVSSTKPSSSIDHSDYEPMDDDSCPIYETIKCYPNDYETIDRNSYNLRNNSKNSSISNTFPNHSRIYQGHSFVSKAAALSEKCYSCDKSIAFYKPTLKCKKCKMTCHPSCKDKCPDMCVPLTPCSSKGSKSTISDYTSSKSSIPSPIIHCVTAIESQGLLDVGLYRKSAVEKEVKEVKEKLLKPKSLIKLNNVSPHVLCGVIKNFFLSLKEPLVPASELHKLFEVLDLEDEISSLVSLYNLVREFPKPNKETLAFLVLHLQRVGASRECKMPLESLAKVLAPTIMGHAPWITNNNMKKETAKQCEVMRKMLIIPSSAWLNILNGDHLAGSKRYSLVSAIKASGVVSTPKDLQILPLYTAVKKGCTSSRDKSFIRST